MITSFFYNPSAIPQLFVGAFLIIQGIFILIQNPRSPLHRSFFFFDCAVFIWLIPMGLAYMTHDARLAGFLTKLGFLGVIYIPITTYIFSVYYAGSMRQKKIILPGVVVTLIVGMLINVSLFTEGIYAYPWGYYIKLGPLSLFAFFLFIVFIPAFINNLYMRYKSARNAQRQWALYTLLTGTFAFLGITDFLPAYGISLPFPPMGYIMVGSFATLMSYFILRYQLADIQLLLGRTIGYIILTIILLFLYTSFFLLLSPTTGNTHILLLNGVFFIVSLYILSLLKNKTQRLVDEIFFKEKVNFNLLINQFNSSLRNLRNCASLLTTLFNFFENNLRVHTSMVFILRKNEMRWHIYKQKHTMTTPIYKEIKDFQTISQYFVNNTDIIPLNSLISQSLLSDTELKHILHLANQHHGSLLIPLAHREEFLGIILLGGKMSGDSYSQKDLKALTNLTVPFVIAWENASHYEALEKSNLLKADFISIASHQLRTPITNVSWTLQSIVAETKGALNDAQKKQIQETLDRIKIIKELIDQLLSIVHFESGELKINPVPCDLTALIQDMLKDLQTVWEKKHITCTYIPEKSLPHVLTDPNYTKIILNILFENAIQYTPSYGSITVATRLISRKETQIMRVMIEDTGIGIPENQQLHVFTHFFRARNAFSLFPNGTGIGLFYAKKLIEALGGSLWFRSIEGKGTTFYFTLPLSPQLHPLN